MANIGSLIASIGVDTRKLRSGMAMAGSIFRRGARRMVGSMNLVAKSIRAVKNSIFSLKGAFAGIVIGGGALALGKSFIDAASTAENYRIRLNALLGSVQEGNKMFKDMSKFASNVAFEYKDIMGAATTLSGVMAGGVEEVKKWMPIIADLAAVSGLSIIDTTNQIVRMYSAGAAAADLFRERGILSMLGFKAGVSVTAKETQERIIAAWKDTDSKFKDASTKMGDTWTGLMSLISDAWFDFRTMVTDAGIFDVLKSGLKFLISEIREMKESGRLQEWAENISNAVVEGIKKLIELGAKSKLIWLGAQQIVGQIEEQIGRIILTVNASKLGDLLSRYAGLNQAKTNLAGLKMVAGGMQTQINMIDLIAKAEKDIAKFTKGTNESIDKIVNNAKKFKTESETTKLNYKTMSKQFFDMNSEMIRSKRLSVDTSGALSKIRQVADEIQSLNAIPVKIIAEAKIKASPIQPWASGISGLKADISSITDASGSFTTDLSGLNGLISSYIQVADKLKNLVNPFSPSHPGFAEAQRFSMLQQQPFMKLEKMLNSLIQRAAQGGDTTVNVNGAGMDDVVKGVEGALSRRINTNRTFFSGGGSPSFG